MSLSAVDVNDPIYGNRQDSYIIEVLNLDNEVEGQLTWSDGARAGVLPGGTLEMSNATDTRETAHLTIVRDADEDMEWLHRRVRISYVGAGFKDPQPLSTLVPTAAPQSYPSTHVKEELELHSMLTILLRSTMKGTFGIDADRVVTNEIATLIAGAGIEDFEVEPSPRVMKSAKVWDPGTTRLRIINDLLEIIGYWSVYTDPLGAIRCKPKIPFDARELVFIFDDQPATGIYMPDWSLDRDLLVPNRCTVIQRVDGIWEPLPISAELPPEHPQSAASRGYYDDRVEVDVDFADDESGYIKALGYLNKGVPSESRTFQHMWVPGVVPNAKVMHRYAGLPDLVASVQSQTYRLSTGGLVETRISEG